MYSMLITVSLMGLYLIIILKFGTIIIIIISTSVLHNNYYILPVSIKIPFELSK